MTLLNQKVYVGTCMAGNIIKSNFQKIYKRITGRTASMDQTIYLVIHFFSYQSVLPKCFLSTIGVFVEL